MIVGAYALVGAAALIAMPAIAGALFFPGSDGLLLEFAIVAVCLFLAMTIKFQAEKLDRNAIQIDYRASEIRLGTRKPDGTFVREKVFAFRDIETVDVVRGDHNTTFLKLEIMGNEVAISFHDTDMSSVKGLASQISAARESAVNAPIRSRIQSRIHGLEASVREVKSRVQSRIAHA